MKYLVQPDSVVIINETSGTIQNVDQANSVELSDTINFSSGIVLYPYQMLKFSNQLYARLYGKGVPSVEINIVPFVIEEASSDMGSGTSIVDLSNYVQKDGDKVLSSNDFTDADKAKLDSLSTDTSTTGTKFSIGSVQPTDTNAAWIDASNYLQ